MLDLFLIFTLAKVLGEVSVRLRQPAVIGELIAGAILGPYFLGLIEPTPIYAALAELGVIILMFQVGLETRVEDLKAVGASAIFVGVLGVFIPFFLGFLVMYLLGYPSIESLFIGTALVATSVGITARVLADLGYLKRVASRIILGAAILDDILGLMVLAVVSSLARGAFNWLEFIILVLEAVFFVVFLLTIGTRLARYKTPALFKLELKEAPFAFSVILCLGLSFLAEYIGLAAIIGAFMAGIVLAEAEERFALEKQFAPVGFFLTPFFFVMMGAYVELTSLLKPSILFLTGVILVVAVVSKVLSGWLGTLKKGFKTSFQTGVGMIPRGEVGIVVGGLGLSLGVIEPLIYTVVVSMSILTTLIAPPLIRWAYTFGKK